jgi:hypothetical protein
LNGTHTERARLASTPSSYSSYATVKLAVFSSEIHISIRTGCP